MHDDRRMVQVSQPPEDSSVQVVTPATFIVFEILWFACMCWLGWILVGEFKKAPVTESGIEFFNLRAKAAFPGIFSIILCFLSMIMRPAKLHWLWFVLQIAFTLTTGVGLSQIATKIEFERTPPCWGIHSVDYLSGEGCPPGMSRKFSREELVRWYENQPE
jgi:hypothetical protein